MEKSILFAENCVPASECRNYQEKLERLGQAALYNGGTRLVKYFLNIEVIIIIIIIIKILKIF